MRVLNKLRDPYIAEVGQPYLNNNKSQLIKVGSVS